MEGAVMKITVIGAAIVVTVVLVGVLIVRARANTTRALETAKAE